MKELQFCGGQWTGFWLQGQTKGLMDLEIHIRGFRVSGVGKDAGGRFQIDGYYEPRRTHIEFEKRYGDETIVYRGEWDGARLKGDWFLPDEPNTACGAFMIWPLA